MSAKRVLVLAAAVATVWALLAAAAWGAGPLFLVGPPITRRVSGFHEFTGGGCTLVLAQGVWTDSFETVSCTNETRADFATCSDTPQRHWRFAGEAQRCGARRMSAADARRLLAGQRLVFAGDSIARNLYGATLRLLGQPGQDIVVGHANFQHELEGGISLHFFWAPYPQNLTAVLGQLATEAAGARAAARGQGEEGEPQEQEQQRDEAGAGGEAGAEVAGEAAGEAGEQREASATDPAAEAQMPAGAEGEPEQRKAQEEQGAAGMPGGSEAADGPVEQQAGQPQEEEQQLQGGEEGVTRRQGRRSLRAAASDSTSAVQAEAGQQEAEEREQQQQQRPPSLAVLSTTLWHLLHFTEASDFEAQLGQLRAAAEGLGPAAGARQGDTAGGGAAPRLVLASGTETFPNRMKTAEKQRNMTPANLDAYNKAMEQSGLLAPAGPFSLLDLFPLTRSCGEECSTDGVHSLPVVYDAALQLLLNIAAADPQAAPQQPARRALRQRLPG